MSKPPIYAMHIPLEFQDNDSQYIRIIFHISKGREVKYLLDMTLTYDPFKNAKALLWKNLIMAFFWNAWKERNQGILAEKIPVIYQAISWCKLSNIFTFYSYTSLLTNWKGLNKHAPNHFRNN